MKVPNTINATLTADEKASIESKIAEVSAAMPFLIDLSPDERQSLPKMGDRSRAFVDRCLEMARQDESFLPRNLDPEDFRRDVELYGQLDGIRNSLARLLELVDDTQVNAGSEAYLAALEVYAAAKRSGRGSALDDLMDDVSQRFTRRRAAEEVPEEVAVP